MAAPALAKKDKLRNKDPYDLIILESLTDNPLGIQVSVEPPGSLPLLPLGLGLPDAPDGLPLFWLLGRFASRQLKGVYELGAIQIFLIRIRCWLICRYPQCCGYLDPFGSRFIFDRIKINKSCPKWNPIRPFFRKEKLPLKSKDHHK